MSKRTKHSPSAITTVPTPPAPTPDAVGPDILRRMVLAVLTAVLVARPFVRAEDPGLISDFSDPGGMVLTTFVFLGCAGWAAWKLWTTDGGVYLGAAEIALGALAVLFFVAASVAPYQRAAYLTASEWLGLAFLLFLTRQLAVRSEEQHGLITALLATAVALCAHGIFQLTWEMPRLAAESDTHSRSVLAHTNARLLLPTPLETQQLTDQLERRVVSGPFFHPASLAACLVLLLPMLVGAVVASLRGKSPGWVTALVIGCALLGAVVLGMTRDAAAAAALAIVGLIWMGLYRPGGAGLGVAAAVIAAGLVVYGLLASGQLSRDVVVWREAWPASWKLVEDHFWRGVGPAQFPFFYPRYMAETAGYNLTEPSSSLLGLLAEVGVGGLLLLGVALFMVFRAVRRWWRNPQTPLAPQPPLPHSGEGEQEGTAKPQAAASGALASVSDVRWEFYLGGMFAAIMSFALRAAVVPPDEVVTEAFAAGLRTVIWFFAFGLFERVSWSPREVVAALLVGVVAMLVLFLVRPGLSYPAVASLMWVAVGIMLAIAQPVPAAWITPRSFAGLLLPLLLGGGFGYFAMVLYPASVASGNAQRAKYAGAVLLYVEMQKKPEEREVKDPVKYLDEKVLLPLKEAERDGRGNVRTLSLLSMWWVRRWALAPVDHRNEQAGNVAVAWAELARQANPEGPDGYVRAYAVHEEVSQTLLELANRLESEAKDPKKKLNARQKADNRLAATNLRKKATEQYNLAARAIEPYLSREPTDPRLRYQAAAARFGAGEIPEGMAHALEARVLDRVMGPSRPRSLSDRQRDQVLKWVTEKSPP